jgi:SAM-dependent methyltransferase
MTIDETIRAYYERGQERDRLTSPGGSLELTRTQELLRRFLPPAPAAILDVGGGAGVHAAWLANGGYRVHLVDPVPLHVEQAALVAAAQPDHPFTVKIGDARRLDESDESFDAVLLLGPLYHLTKRPERIAALQEAKRIVRPGGVVLAVGISRFGSLLDGLYQGLFGDPGVASMIENTLSDGQHRHLDSAEHPGWFTTAYFHLPDELASEMADSGLALEALLGIEGPGGFVGDGRRDPAQLASLARAARLVEAEPSLMGVSSHILAVGRRSY